MCNRFTRGRPLDAASTSGGDRLLQDLALAVCAQAGLALRVNPRDTTRCARSGADVPERDAHAIPIPHGSATEHRPDLQQAVWALLGSQDGGVPGVRKSWDGTPADLAVFQERAQALLSACKNAPSPRSLSAEAQRSHEDHAPHREKIGGIPRLPNTRGVVAQGLTQALPWETWPPCDDHPRSQRLALCHSGMAQRWRVGDAQAARERAAVTGNNATQREAAAIEQPLFPLPAQRVPLPAVAHEALTALAQRWRDPRVESSHLREHQRDAGTGRPTPPPPLTGIAWHRQAHVRPDDETIGHHKQGQACCVLGTTIGPREWWETAVIAASKGQSRVAGGCRCLTDPRCFVSSLLGKKPRRIAGLLMVMPLALLGYAVAQRRLRQQ